MALSASQRLIQAMRSSHYSLRHFARLVAVGHGVEYFLAQVTASIRFHSQAFQGAKLSRTGRTSPACPSPAGQFGGLPKGRIDLGGKVLYKYMDMIVEFHGVRVADPRESRLLNILRSRGRTGATKWESRPLNSFSTGRADFLTPEEGADELLHAVRFDPK
jgi:hypothetical protein